MTGIQLCAHKRVCVCKRMHKCEERHSSATNGQG